MEEHDALVQPLALQVVGAILHDSACFCAEHPALGHGIEPIAEVRVDEVDTAAAWWAES